MANSEIKKLIEDLKESYLNLAKAKSRTIKREIDKSSLKSIINISFEEEIPIPKEDFRDKNLIKDYRYWILKLDRYYKDPATKLNQINSQSLKTYANLCLSLESYLNKNNTSIDREVSKLRREGIYHDIYYTLYKIGENAVIDFYNPLNKKQAYKSYMYLENQLGSQVVSFIKKELDLLIAKLDPPDAHTREYFNLTENNRVSLWWDVDGSKREKFNFDKEETLAINQLTKRNNALWQNKEVYDILIDLFLSSLRALFDNTDIDTSNIKRVISPYKQSKMILDSLFLITEENLREKFIFYHKINTTNAIENLKKLKAIDILDYIQAYQKSYIDSLDEKKVNDIYSKFFLENPNKVKDLISFTDRLDLDEKIDFILKFKDKENYNQISRKLVKSDNKQSRAVGLFLIYKNEINSPSDKKALFELINKNNYDTFLELIKSNNLDKETIYKILDLENIKAKKIKMDMDKIKISRQNLSKTVDMVNTFIDEEIDFENDDLEQKNSEEIVGKNEESYDDILLEILKEGSYPLDEFKNIAKNKGLTANTLLGEINDSLYDYFDDQLLIIEGENIIVDPFYIDMLKEYISGK